MENKTLTQLLRTKEAILVQLENAYRSRNPRMVNQLNTELAQVRKQIEEITQ